MNGKVESSIDERWNEFAEIANTYLAKLKLKSIKVDEDVQTVLGMNSETFRILAAEDCLSYAFLLDRYAFTLQNELNGHAAKLNWAKHNLDVSIGHILATSQWGTQYTKYEEKRLMIISENSYCKALNQMVLESSSIMHYLDSMSYKVGTIAKTLKDIAYNKRKAE